jgi:hypothetical protein
MMKEINYAVVLAGAAVALFLSAGHVAAQGRGNFDPAQFRQRMMDNYKERLEVTDDAEWKIIEERITKVVDAQRETRIGGPGMFGRGRGGGPGGPGGGAGGAGGGAGADNNGGQRRDRPNPFAADNPQAEALQKALDGKASSEEIKTKLAKLRESVKEKEAALAKAQEELRKVLSVRQEATALLMGLLK